MWASLLGPDSNLLHPAFVIWGNLLNIRGPWFPFPVNEQKHCPGKVQGHILSLTTPFLHAKTDSQVHRFTDSQVSVTCIYHPKHISLASTSHPNYIFLMKWPQKSLCHLGEEPPCLWLAVCSSVRAVYWCSLLPSKPESGKLVGPTALDSRLHRDRKQQKTLLSVNAILRDIRASYLHVKEGEVSLWPRIFTMWGDKIQDLT